MSQRMPDITADDDRYHGCAHWLGQALLNCGLIEMCTYTYVATLEGCDVFANTLRGKLFTVRSERIRELINATAIPAELKTRAVALWKEADAVMRLRNILAHNPITIESQTNKLDITEEFVTIVDMGDTAREDVRRIRVGEVAKLANRAQTLSTALTACLAEIQRELEAYATQ